ncbi:3-oxo-5-alpha-steroid 4-dehydrogenase-domain-containing protein [Entophlyctis helioformis]|nr:3-oxo-5-alpha-steroid 4-dehydrogenase-domain-containing protein [Entophlyctis helioformis]
MDWLDDSIAFLRPRAPTPADIPETLLYARTLAVVLLHAPLLLVILNVIVAPYGKFNRPGFGPTVNGKLGWLFFESIPVVAFYLAVTASSSLAALSSTQLVLVLLWEVHYIHRSLVYTWRAPGMAPMSVFTVLGAICFNVPNGYVNGRFVGYFGDLPDSVATSPRFLAGVAVFAVGMVINIWADNVLFGLRRGRHAGGERYSVPLGGLYSWVSCPNYLGEILEWVGWAIATGSWAGTAFALFTACNLVPRAIKQHAWYQATFPNYPRSRKAVIPLLL